MKKIAIILYMAINSTFLIAQISLTIEGKNVNNTETGTWLGVNISRNQPTILTYRNNSITSLNTLGYLLQAGDESVASGTNNNLDGEVITGNKLNWSGTKSNSIIPHGIFAGCNINAVVKFNYLNQVPMAIIRKSASNMSDNSGGVAYNIVKGGSVAVNIKGISNVKIYNNTLYSDRTTLETYRGLVDIYTNTDATPNSVAHGTIIKNNIFYTKYATNCIQVDDADALNGLVSDYNIFYSEAGSPLFDYCGTTKTFAQWQALGYDTHSKVINPNFNNFTEFVPAARLDYGTDLGTTWQTGLSTSAVWTVGSAPATTDQNGTWQVGARIYDVITENPVFVSSVIENATPNILEMTYSTTLANIVPVASSFLVIVNSVARTVSAVAISGTKVKLTLANDIKYDEIVTVSYTKPVTNPLQTATGGIAASITAQSTIINLINPSKVVVPVTITMTISPNRVHKVLNVQLVYSSSPSTALTPEIFRIYDLSVKLVFEKLKVTGATSIKIPINLPSGIYNVLILAGGVEMASQRMKVY
jgi:uncharacterized repeat protein (TIGR02059 family)